MKTIDAIAITPVASQPITDHAREIVKSPSIFTLVAIRMRSAMTGTATMALTTADHTNALTGLIDSTFAAAPMRVAAMMVA